MQFGRFHGVAFLAFGALLVLVQLALFFAPKRDINSSVESPGVARKTSPIAGIVGGVSLAIGAGLFLAHRRQSGGKQS